MKTKLILATIVGLLAAAVAQLQAAIPVVNAGFEANGTTKTWFWDWNGSSGTGARIPGAIPGWAVDDDPGIGGYGGKGDTGVESGGVTGFRLFVNSIDCSVWQTTSYVIQSGDAFILSWDMLGNWGSDRTDLTRYVQATLYYFDGANRVAMGSAAVTEPENYAWLPYSYTLSSVPPAAVGYSIGIEFDEIDNLIIAGEQSWIGIDNVTLVPEPASVALLGLGGLASLLALRRRRA